MSSLGEAVLELKADGSKLTATLNTAKGQVQQAVREINSNLGSLGSTLNNLGGSFTRIIPNLSMMLKGIGDSITRNVTLPVTGVIAALGLISKNAIETGADFEKAMSGVAATLEATKDELEQLKNLAMDLGMDPTLIVSASQAAAVMEELAKNGLTVDEILNGAARAAIALANATGGDFATAASIAATAMQLFNLNGAQMADIVNVITGVANASRFSIEDFAMAMAMGGGVAASMGVSVEEFATVIAMLSNSFSSGSDAGTSLKVMMQRLIPQSDEAAEWMKKLGIITEEMGNRFFDAEGNMKSMAEIAEILQEALEGLSDAERIEALSAIFGTDAMRAANALAEAGAEGYAKFAEIMNNTDAAENAKTRMDNLAGAIEILKGIIEGFKIKFTDAFGPGIRRIVEAFSEFLTANGGTITNLFQMLASVFNGFADKMAAGILQNGPGVLEFFRTVIASLPILIDKIQILGEKAAPTIQKFFDALLAVTPDQIAEIFGAIGGLAAAGPLLSLLGSALPALAAFAAFLASGIQVNKDDIIDFFSRMKEVLPEFVEKIKEIGAVAGPHLQKLFDAFMNIKPETVVLILEIVGALALLGPVFVGLAGLITTVTSIVTAISGIAGAVGGIGSLLAGLGAFFLTPIGAILLLVAAIVGLYLAFKMNLGGIRTTVEQLGFIISFYFKQMASQLGTTLTQLGGIIVIGFSRLKDSISQIWQAALNGIISYFAGKVAQGISTAQNFVNGIRNAFNINWMELGKRIVDGIVQGLKNGASAIVEAAKAAAKAALDAAKKALGIKSPSTAFMEIGNFSGLGFVQGFAKTLTPQAVSGTLNRVVAGAGQTINRSMQNVINIHNPMPERSSESVDKTLRKMSYLGVIK